MFFFGQKVSILLNRKVKTNGIRLKIALENMSIA